MSMIVKIQDCDLTAFEAINDSSWKTYVILEYFSATHQFQGKLVKLLSVHKGKKTQNETKELAVVKKNLIVRASTSYYKPPVNQTPKRWITDEFPKFVNNKNEWSTSDYIYRKYDYMKLRLRSQEELFLLNSNTI